MKKGIIVSILCGIFFSGAVMADRPPPAFEYIKAYPEKNLTIHPKYKNGEALKLYYYETCNGEGYFYTDQPLNLSSKDWKDAFDSISLESGRALAFISTYADPNYHEILCRDLKKGKFKVEYDLYNKKIIAPLTQDEVDAMEKKGGIKL